MLVDEFAILENQITHTAIDVTFKTRECLLLRKLIRTERLERRLCSVREHNIDFFDIALGLSILECALTARVVVHNTAHRCDAS